MTKKGSGSDFFTCFQHDFVTNYLTAGSGLKSLLSLYYIFHSNICDKKRLRLRLFTCFQHDFVTNYLTAGSGLKSLLSLYYIFHSNICDKKRLRLRLFYVFSTRFCDKLPDRRLRVEITSFTLLYIS